ncbi:hypothetical protein GQ44DRAFT_696225, partial [Phaeosphaeriaceae sp. PMI808]
MTSFKFPPPPPPPPKASSNDNQSSYPSQRGARSRGPGESQRGRGGHIRGGANNHPGNARDRHGQAYNGRGNAHNRGGSREGNQSHRRGEMQIGSSGFSHGHLPPYATPVPTQGSVATHLQSGEHAQPQAEPNAFAQTMSFMATPAGAQSMAAFASHMANANNLPSAQTAPTQLSQQSLQYSPTQQAGQKRKWGEGYKAVHTQSQRKRKPPRAKAEVPPTIPTFGFALPKPGVAHSSKPIKNKAKESKGSKVDLGLAHVPMLDESSDEENLDEESAFGAKLYGGGYVFEHDGENISLQTAGDIAEWIKDRRKNFPTRQKAIEKAEAATTRRRKELDFVRRLRGVGPQSEAISHQDVAPHKDPTPKAFEKNRGHERKQVELAALRKRLHESMQKKQVARVGVDLGLGYGSETESGDDNSSVLSESSVVSSLEESSEESDLDSDDNDAPPKPLSSKTGPLAINVPPSVPSQRERKLDKEIICTKWRQTGKCSFGHSCKFKHPGKEDKPLGLYGKLVEQELVKADQFALEAIKYLGQHGFL